MAQVVRARRIHLPGHPLEGPRPRGYLTMYRASTPSLSCIACCQAKSSKKRKFATIGEVCLSEHSGAQIDLSQCGYPWISPVYSLSLYRLQLPSSHLLPSANAEGGSRPQRRIGYFVFDQLMQMPLAHATPQAPQLSGSDCKSTLHTGPLPSLPGPLSWPGPASPPGPTPPSASR